MAAERLSKLQKFILSAAYKKTVLKEELPVMIDAFGSGLHPSEASLKKHPEIENEHNARMTEIYYSALYESDIMMNYYNRWTPDENYGYEGGSNKEKTALRRSLKTLNDRGYINEWGNFIQNTRDGKGFYTSGAIITLTYKGKETAERLLNVVDMQDSDDLQQ